MAEPDDDSKKRRRYPTVLVSIPGWPSQDPGRLMLYSVRPTPQKAARMAKRLRRQLPEFDWTVADLTAAQAREIKQAPFVINGALMAVPMQCRWTGRTWKVTPVAPS